MASVDIINSQSCQVQIMQYTPTVVVDKTDGLQLYLSKDCLDVEILTAKSSQVNVLLPSDDDDFSEKAISEQFKTTIVDGKVVTVPMEHE
ncbi:suppressor of rasval19 [Entomophthora muscae]|nr:suppressor of rasval19 [Entomophthora muscae]